MSFAGKIILVTGASSGIGADAARHLAKLGGKVALVGRNEAKLSAVIDQIKKDGSPTPLAIAADVTKDAERIINETVKHFGQLDVLVNNAGIVDTGSVVDVKIESYDRVMNTNVRSVIILTQLAVPHLAKSKGNIVNISSIAGLRPSSNYLAYSMSKSALDQFTKCVALELAPEGIRVNSVNPGAIKTPIFATFDISDEETERIQKVIASKYPVGRIGTVADTSAAIAYLASDAASFITGELLTVDGGAITAGISANVDV